MAWNLEVTTPLDKLLQQEENPQAVESLQLIQKNTSYLINLTNPLLDFRKNMSPEEGLYFTRTDIKQLLKDTKQRYQTLISPHKLACTLQLPDTPPHAFVDTADRKSVV